MRIRQKKTPMTNKKIYSVALSCSALLACQNENKKKIQVYREGYVIRITTDMWSSTIFSDMKSHTYSRVTYTIYTL